MLVQFNALVLDVIVVVLLLSTITIGLFKGIKHEVIDFGLFIGSFALSFSPLLNILKKPIVKLLAKLIKLGAGITPETKLGVYLVYVMLSSIILTIIVYALLQTIKILIFHFIKKSMQNRNKLIKRPDKFSRIFGVLFSLVFEGTFFILCLSVFASPLFGEKTVKNSYVTKYIADVDDKVFDLLFDDDLTDEKILTKLVKGNIMAKVDDDEAKAMQRIANLVNEGKLTPTSFENIQETLNYMHSLLLFASKNGINDKGEEIDEFDNFVKETRKDVEDSINAMSKLDRKESISAKGTLAIDSLLKKMDMMQSAAIFESIFVIR